MKIPFSPRKALQVRRLGLQIEAGRHATSTDLDNQFRDLAQILHLCSPTLQVLRLRLLQATNYRDYEMDALDPSQLEAILVSACFGQIRSSLGALLCCLAHSLLRCWLKNNSSSVVNLLICRAALARASSCVCFISARGWCPACVAAPGTQSLRSVPICRGCRLCSGAWQHAALSAPTTSALPLWWVWPHSQPRVFSSCRCSSAISDFDDGCAFKTLLDKIMLQWRTAICSPMHTIHFNPTSVADMASQAAKICQLLQVSATQSSRMGITRGAR